MTWIGLIRHTSAKVTRRAPVGSKRRTKTSYSARSASSAQKCRLSGRDSTRKHLGWRGTESSTLLWSRVLLWTCPCVGAGDQTLQSKTQVRRQMYPNDSTGNLAWLSLRMDAKMAGISFRAHVANAWPSDMSTPRFRPSRWIPWAHYLWTAKALWRLGTRDSLDFAWLFHLNQHKT